MAISAPRQNNGADRLPKNVHLASERDKEEWDRFVDCEGGSFFHYFEWKYIYENRGQNRYIPLMIRDTAGGIAGIFPVVEQPGPVYPSLSSLPEGASDGFLVKNTLRSDEKDQIVREFLRYIDSNYSQSHALFSLRHHLPFSPGYSAPSPILIENGYRWKDNLSTRLPCTYVVPLDKQFREKVFRSMAKNLRNRLRHGKKCGVEVIIDENFAYFDEIARMHIDMVKKFGMIRRKEDYDQILRVFRKKIKLFVGLVGSEPITALLTYYTPTAAYAAIGPYNSKAAPYQNNILPMCASIRDACYSGYRYYDMGITQTPSLAAYKEKFGATRVPMMIYQKRFSRFKLVANKTGGTISRNGRKILDLLKLQRGNRLS